ncbi:MAG TPA: M56 family metallopeptidase [Candidatus Acidoferrum sp.]|nr:M56 family metallopeptidase [Candidatus Acidoferrum sp.]
MSWQTSVQAAAVFLLENSAKATLLFAGAWAVAFALRRRSAAQRHQVWLAALLASLVLPIVAPILPAWHSRTLTAAVEQITGTSASSNGAPSNSSLVVNAVDTAPAAKQPASWPGVLLLVWIAGSALALIRFGAGFAHMARVRARSKRLTDEHSIRDVTKIARTLRISRAIHLFESADPVAMPLAWGLLVPKILLPSSAREWPDDRRRIVLCHELAHVARHDCAAQLLGELVRAIYWFNPLAWLAVYRLRRESERACDDSVLNAGIEPRDYADDLLAIARMLDTRSNGWVPALAMARSTDFERRITAMLNPIVDRRGCSSKSKAILSLAALLLLLPLAAVRLGAQNTSATFAGTVYGPGGALASDATVIMIDVRANIRNMTASGADGRFEISGLPGGEYELQVMKLGCKTYDAQNISLQPGETRSLDVNLVSVPADEAAAPPKQTVAQKIRVAGNVEESHLFTTVPPKYPAAAKSQGIQGTVVLRASIAKDGTVESLVVSNQADPLLARSAVEAVSHWRYRPVLLNGQPIAVETEISVVYSLRS